MPEPTQRNVTIEAARSLILQAASTLWENKSKQPSMIDLWAATGRTLAQNVLADYDLPRFDKSAMDGFACRSADLAAGPANLRIVGEAAAGTGFTGVVGAGEAVAIMTGAPVPQGADAVEIIENAVIDGEHVTLPVGLPVGKHIRFQGENIRQGQVVVESGRRVEGLTVGVLASVGAAEVSVLPAPRVTVFSSGSELVATEATPGPGQIRDSNRQMLLSLLAAEGVAAVDGGRVVDERSAIIRAIRTGCESDVLILSGGVSVGTYDLVAEAFRTEGVDILLHKVMMKPGKPLLVGLAPNTILFGLPGNPVSTCVTALLFVLPAIRAMSGRAPGPFLLKARLEGELEATGGRPTFHPGHYRIEDGGDARVTPIAWSGSADQAAYSKANVLIRKEAHSPAATSGDTLPVVFPRMPYT